MSLRKNKAGARQTLYRVTKIWAILRTTKTPITSIQLAAEFEVSRKTIARDLDFLRDSIGLPIEWSVAANSYKVVHDRPLNWWLLAAEEKR